MRELSSSKCLKFADYLVKMIIVSDCGEMIRVNNVYAKSNALILTSNGV
jgi:hypothetical protein